MQGAKTIVTEPDAQVTVTVNQSGQAYLGTELAGKEVDIVMKVVEEQEPSEAKPEATAD